MKYLSDMYLSLQDSILKAKGVPLTYKQMKTMTLEEFMRLMAPNGIRFIYDSNQVDRGDTYHECKYEADEY